MQFGYEGNFSKLFEKYFVIYLAIPFTLEPIIQNFLNLRNLWEALPGRMKLVGGFARQDILSGTALDPLRTLGSSQATCLPNAPPNIKKTYAWLFNVHHMF